MILAATNNNLDTACRPGPIALCDAAPVSVAQRFATPPSEEGEWARRIP